MGKGNIDQLEDLNATNAQLQEDNNHLKEKLHMLNQRMAEMERQLEISSKFLPLLKNKFKECHDSLTTVMEYWDGNTM
jgi:predicted nuclease with TOPRIM domain